VALLSINRTGGGKIVSWKTVKEMTMNIKTTAGALIGCFLLLLSGCAGESKPTGTWSTKSHSVFKDQAPDAALNAGESISVYATPEDLRTNAISLLMQAAESTNPLLRANAVEALQYAPDYLQRYIPALLHDDNRGVRYITAMTVGRNSLTDHKDRLEALLHDHSPSVRAAAIYALRQSGEPVDPSPLSDMLMSRDPEIRANAANVLGELGNRSAIPMIRLAVGAPMSQATPARVKMVELQLAEALAMLGGSEKDYHPIHAALYARPEEAELTVLACQICRRLGDEGVSSDLQNLVHRSGKFQRPAEVRLAAAAALGSIDPGQTSLEVPFEYMYEEDYVLRAQAAHTMGALGDAVAFPRLAIMMDDPNPIVQVSAAAAILELCQTVR